ncbi:alpha/beta fold hydrolase [Yoonia sp. MH D7]
MIEPLVLIPPMLCDARVFYAQIAALSATTPMTFVPISQGERIEEMASVILSWLPSKFALAGMGLGGMVAMEILRRAPERVTRVAFIATNAQADTPEVSALREPLIIAAKTGRFDDAIKAETNPAWLAPGPYRMDVLSLVSDMAHDLGAEAYVRQSRAMQRRKDQQNILRKIKQPALVMCGYHDGQNTLRRHEFIAELIPYAKLEVIEDAGHLPTLESPEAVTRALRAWMKQPLVLR